ncbi:MAG: hypothetical protein KU38_06890 [Sulfurovum sp. FS08-3]|nr:MAG: hypothetical protein KU38_06890 [Sulfurovum sp. FS08-3]
MNIKRYKLEIIVASAMLFMLLGFGYKMVSHSSLKESKVELSQAQIEVSRIIALQELWGDKALSKKLNALESTVAKEKIESFGIKSQKLTATFKSLSIDELNRLSNKIATLAVVIDKFLLTKEDKTYRLELVCKW